MTATLTQTQTPSTITDDTLSHRFCKDQAQAWQNGQPATARCGKTKTTWQRATGTDLLCAICWDLYKNNHCTHCQKDNQ